MPTERPSAEANRDRLVAGLHAALHGMDASQIPTIGIHCNLHVGDVFAVLSVWPWEMARPLAPGEHPIRVIPVSQSPTTPSAPAAPVPARVPHKLTPQQKALWEATTSEPVIAYVLARRIGKNKLGTTIYQGLRKLRDLGLIELTVDGYRRLVDPPPRQ